MADKLAAFSIRLRYTNNLDIETSAPHVDVTAPYQALADNTIDVPDGENGTTYDVSFGSIGEAATAFLLRNDTGQDVQLAIDPIGLPDGAIVVVVLPSAPAADQLLTAQVTLAGTQTGAGRITTMVFGDPVD